MRAKIISTRREAGKKESNRKGLLSGCLAYTTAVCMYVCRQVFVRDSGTTLLGSDLSSGWEKCFLFLEESFDRVCPYNPRTDEKTKTKQRTHTNRQSTLRTDKD